MTAYDRMLQQEAEEWNDCYNNPDKEDYIEVPVNKNDSIDDIFNKLKKEILKK